MANSNSSCNNNPNPITEPIKYFLYARKSTESEDRQILSIEAQIKEDRELAQKEQLEIVEEFIESKSAKAPGRPIFNTMMAKVQASKEPIGIIAWSPDRLSRNSVDGGLVIYLIDTSKLASLRFPTYKFDADPNGKFMLQILFGQSKYQVDKLSIDVKRGIRMKIDKGEYHTKAPLGYLNRMGKIYPDPKREYFIKRGFELYASGRYSLRQLASVMYEEGFRYRSGYKVRKSSWERILKNKTYVGFIPHLNEWHKGKHTPIISQALFDQCQATSQYRSRPRPVTHQFLYRGFVKCAVCGCLFTTSIKKPALHLLLLHQRALHLRPAPRLPA